MRVEKKILLFETPGAEQTDATLRAAKERAGELGIDTVVLATTTGATALKAQEIFGASVKIIGVTLQAGTWKKYAPPDPKLVEKVREQGGIILTATHALMGNVGSAIRDKFGGLPAEELIAYTYYTFGQGMKVSVKDVVISCRRGVLEEGIDVISLAGSSRGADTAIVIRSSRDFFAVKIREIICMPR